MLKNNRKKRALEFIRFKNRLRGGLPVFTYQKISKELWDNLEDRNKFLEYAKKNPPKKIQEKYKLNLVFYEYILSCEANDFIKDIVTVKYKYKHSICH